MAKKSIMTTAGEVLSEAAKAGLQGARLVATAAATNAAKAAGETVLQAVEGQRQPDGRRTPRSAETAPTRKTKRKAKKSKSARKAGPSRRRSAAKRRAAQGRGGRKKTAKRRGR